MNGDCGDRDDDDASEISDPARWRELQTSLAASFVATK